MGTITGFSSSRLTQPPKTLTFANTVAGLGGLFNADQCITDYFALGNGLPVSSSPTADISTSGSRKYNAAITSLSGNLAPGVRAKIFVLGDLRITGNIDYTTPNWVGIQDIPSLQVFVSGNIYIDPGVSRITGMFVAQPRTGVANTGTIVTCSKNGTSTYAPSELYDSPCNSRLSVRGSFIAEKIRFTRVAGSLQEAVAGTENRAATSRAGEIFELTPDLYLANPGTTSSTGTYGDKYDFITALPPIL